MNRNNVPYEKIVFVCLNERESGACCAAGGSKRIHEQLKAAIKERNLGARIRVSRSGCLNCCARGPNVMIFPDNRWYSGVTEADVPDLLSELVKDVAPPA